MRPSYPGDSEAARLPVAVVYRTLSGIATLVWRPCARHLLRLFQSGKAVRHERAFDVCAVPLRRLTLCTLGAFRAVCLYGVAVAIIGYVASPAILTIDEMASGCQRKPRPRRGPNAANLCRLRTVRAYVVFHLEQLTEGFCAVGPLPAGPLT